MKTTQMAFVGVAAAAVAGVVTAVISNKRASNIKVIESLTFMTVGKVLWRLARPRVTFVPQHY